MEFNYKYRFDVISEISGRQEPYIGIFNSKDEALNWLAENGKWHKKRGRELILVQCSAQYKDLIAHKHLTFEDNC
jgi:hypothetical protein